MAEDCVNHAVTLGRLEDVPCVTRSLKLHGYHDASEELGNLWVYGSDAEGVKAVASNDPKLLEPMHPDLTYCEAEVIWAVRHEMARTVEDILSRRTRALLLNARAAIALAPKVAELMSHELGKDAAWVANQVSAFRALAQNYLVQ
jgi:glycerol-3-phosphate dehydrogenase